MLQEEEVAMALTEEKVRKIAQQEAKRVLLIYQPNPKKKPRVRTPMSKVKTMLRDLWKKATKRYPGLDKVSLKTDKTVRDKPRHYAAYDPKNKAILVAPEITQLPPSNVRGLLAHELGHAVVHQCPRWREKKGYDACERQADRAAEKACDLRIYYDKLGVQCAGRGARGTRPRPKGLR